MKLLLVCLGVAACASGGEYAVLITGARLHAERHQTEGDWVCLYTRSGTTHIPASLIASWEQEEYVPAAPAPAPDSTRRSQPDIAKLVDQAAERHGLPKEFVHSVVAAESGYRAEAVSPKGAIGLMQLMPQTARAYGADPYDPQQNLDAGTRYLRDLLLKYDHGMFSALAAYNAGPGAVARYNGVPPYRETQEYVSRVYRNYLRRRQSAAYGNP